MKYSVFLRDIDPDTGGISQIIKMCDCSAEAAAKQIQFALASADDSNPNREYFIERGDKRENWLVCIDPDQLEEAWKFQIWLKDRGIRGVVCFSKADLEIIRDAYIGYGIPYSVIIIGPTETWKGVNFDLHVSQLDPSDFESIIR